MSNNMLLDHMDCHKGKSSNYAQQPTSVLTTIGSSSDISYSVMSYQPIDNVSECLYLSISICK